MQVETVTRNKLTTLLGAGAAFLSYFNSRSRLDSRIVSRHFECKVAQGHSCGAQYPTFIRSLHLHHRQASTVLELVHLAGVSLDGIGSRDVLGHDSEALLRLWKCVSPLQQI